MSQPSRSRRTAAVNTLAAPSRRQFLSASAAVTALAALPHRMTAQVALPVVPESTLASDPRRPQFHLLPARNWMNDPNGPIYFNGHYHMFFQYNPYAATWGDMHWNHAVSPDMLHWRHLPVALAPTPGGDDSFGVFSGSAIQVGERVYAVYTGTRHSDDAHATIRDGANNIQESQCLAWSDDPLLVQWTKDPNPVIPVPPTGLAITGFRDPSLWHQGNGYYVTVGSGIEGLGGCVLLYHSTDLRHWTYLHKLTSGDWNGLKTANPCDDGEMWECPEFFPLGDPAANVYGLIYSTLGKVFWQTGHLDHATMRFQPAQSGLLDLDAFYAPKTQLDADGRRILWGWVPERRSDAAMTTAGWSGLMSLPRVLTADSDLRLRMEILPRTAQLRGDAIAATSWAAGVSQLTLPAANGELLLTGSATTALDLRLTLAPGTNGNPAELLRVAYLPKTHSFRVWGTSSGPHDGVEVALQPGDQPTLHAFVDGSVVELILSRRIGCTVRFYYAGSAAPDVLARFSGASQAQAWAVQPISNNRLTTPAEPRAHAVLVDDSKA